MWTERTTPRTYARAVGGGPGEGLDFDCNSNGDSEFCCETELGAGVTLQALATIFWISYAAKNFFKNSCDGCVSASRME